MSPIVEIETAYAVEQALALYDHFVDNAEWDQLESVLDDRFVLLTPAGRFQGLGGARRYETLAGEHVPAHHVVNTQVEATETPALVRAWSRFLLVTWEYQARVGDYLDLLRVSDGAAKLVVREVVPRGAGGVPVPEHASVTRWRAVGA